MKGWTQRTLRQTRCATLVSLACGVFGLVGTVQGAGQYLKVDYPGSTAAGELQTPVTYTLWIPDGAPRLRGIIVHQHGAGTTASIEGSTAAYDLHWQALAQKWDCALFSSSYHVSNEKIDLSPGGSELWFDPRHGSEKTFLKALGEFAAQSGHAEIETVPWALWGHSGGGIWADVMSTLHPERIAVIWMRSGSALMFRPKPEFPQPEVPAGVYAIPSMCNPGVKEKPNLPWVGTLATFNEYRAKGAPIGFAPDPRTGHECGDSRYLAIPFFDACLAMRLPDKGSKDQTLKPVDQSHAWLATPLGDQAVPAASYQGDPKEAVWLPNEAVARAWMEYVKTGAVSDTTPPPTPYSVKATDEGEQGTHLTWSADADFESGIRCFVVLRDGQELAQVLQTPIGKYGRPLFQSMTYHDTPGQPLPQMQYVDASTKHGEKHAYTVITVNSLGLKSEPSTSATTTTSSQLLPWQREMPLREAAQSVALESTLNPTNPQPDYGGNPFPGPAMTINNLKMRTTMWGPPQRITISLTRNNVWDRRLHEFPVPTLQEITEGAFAPVNKDYVGVGGNSLRPIDLGWLRKEGGSYDPYRKPMRYAFPCLKPVGQIILGIDPLAGAEAPHLKQSCANGVVNLQVAKGDAKANLEYVLGMTSNIYAIRGDLSGIASPVWLRLYRHRDTTHLMYMTPDGKYTSPEAEADKAFNGPIDPPTSGQDGPYFWIRQKMPAEKTFPQGFEYVLMGMVATPGKTTLETAEGKTRLGTPPQNQALNGEWKNVMRPAIADAPGAAATATFAPGADGKLEAFVTIVTTMDGKDLIALAKKRLDDAKAGGFDGVAQENTRWWNAFYDKREEGRMFFSSTGRACSDDIHTLYRSYADSHGGGTKTDMRRFEGSASYALPERDFQEWDSAPCYNEIFTTSRFVRNWADNQDMWKQIVTHWLPGSQQNAKDMFNLPGMLITHGYLPPVKPDKYVHTTITLELCLGTMAQIVRPAWDEWDYGGDAEFLRRQCYPLMREMALFYAAYAKKGDDGYYHVIPSMEEERWGVYPAFARNKDVINSLCMFRWALLRTADAAEFLGIDADLVPKWREVAAHVMSYPTWDKSEGKIFAGMPGVEPRHLPGDHFGDAAAYPTILADEINLDSPQDQKDMMLRSVRTLRSGSTNGTLILLGQPPEATGGRSARAGGPDAEWLLNSRSGRMHLFPVPTPSPDAAFHKFQARGGFLVSACKNAGGVYYLEIESRRDIPCRVMNPWPGQSVVVRDKGKSQPVPVQVDRSNGECLTFATVAGHEYLVERE